jgi:lipopolysaccharide/colanic/teichoic acid biosynthesis glycosyltransferase
VRGRSELGFEEMIRLDVEYASNWSILRDVVILLETAPAVLRGRGAC